MAHTRTFAFALLSLPALILAACANEPTADDLSPEDGAAAEDGVVADDADEEPDEAGGGNGSDADLSSNVTEGCVEQDTDGDLFPDKVTTEEATTFSVEYHDSYKLVEVNIPETDDTLSFALTQCGVGEPGDLDDDVHLVEVPVETTVTLTTANIPHLVELGVDDQLIGVGVGDFVTTPEVAERVEAGELPDLADESGDPDEELLLDADPDVMFTDAFGPTMTEDLERLFELGIPAVPNADFNESSLLARAEWLKFTSLFFNAEAAAQEVYDEITTSFAELSELADEADDAPRVLTEQPFEGTWYVPGAESLVAEGIERAGGEYVFDSVEGTGSTGLDIETVLDSAADADVWLAAGSVHMTLDDLVAEDERFSAIQAVDDQNVWAIDGNLSPGGGYPIYEEAYTRADYYLADLLAVLHPDLLPDHDLRYFEPVGSQVE